MKNRNETLIDLMDRYSQFRINEIKGRYLTLEHIKPLLDKLKEKFIIEEIGRSFEGRPIHAITLGEGKNKILAWSQMHGNESTTTKAVFDVLEAFFIFPDNALLKFIRENITIKIIPMLNPDGAVRYTRHNANNTDLNRDALKLTGPESKVLRNMFTEFNPGFCFNLHDQRTIFSAGNSAYPATLSFLTPAMDEKHELYPERQVSMQVIAAITSDLRKWLPNEIGRYSDEFNPNCTGDTFQSLGTPTILFEAGHSPGDYQREITRKYVTTALFSALSVIAEEKYASHNYEDYFEVPENKKLFFDIILRNALVNHTVVDIAIQYKEVLENGRINFYPSIEKIGKSLDFYGHKEIMCENLPVTLSEGNPLRENVIVKNIYLNNEVLAINYQNI
jgi:hypothetical protein